MRVARQGKVSQIAAGIRCTIRSDETVALEASQRVKELDIDEVRRVEIAVLGQALDQSPRRPSSDDRVEHRGGVDNEHRSAAIAAFADGGDDRFPGGAAGSRVRASQQVGHGRVTSDALELFQNEVGERHASSGRARPQHTVDVVGDVPDLDRLHGQMLAKWVCHT